MGQFIANSIAAFLGTLAAIQATRFWLEFPSHCEPSIAPAQRTLSNKLVAVSAAGISATVAAFMLYCVSQGQLDPGLARIATVVALFTLVYIIRVLR